MRFFHISDLHLGKTLYGYSLIENQKQVLSFVVEKIAQYSPDVLIVAGDIYDKTSPSNEAIACFDEFLTTLHTRFKDLKVVIIAGNHDSFAKLNYASAIMKANNIYINALTYTQIKPEEPICIHTNNETTYIHSIAFSKPNYLQFENSGQMSYTEMMNHLLDKIDTSCLGNHLLVAHQFFVEGSFQPTLSESEVYPLINGGLDSVDICQLKKTFDYIACGHLHTFQQVGNSNAYYSGSIYKYSLSEVYQDKVIVMGDIIDHHLTIHPIKIKFDQDVLLIKGTYEDIINQYSTHPLNDYVAIELSEPVSDPLMQDKIFKCFKNLLTIQLANTKIKSNQDLFEESIDLNDNIFTHFSALYNELTSTNFNQLQNDYLNQLMNTLFDETN